MTNEERDEEVSSHIGFDPGSYWVGFDENAGNPHEWFSLDGSGDPVTQARRLADDRSHDATVDLEVGEWAVVDYEVWRISDAGRAERIGGGRSKSKAERLSDWFQPPRVL